LSSPRDQIKNKQAHPAQNRKEIRTAIARPQSGLKKATLIKRFEAIATNAKRGITRGLPFSKLHWWLQFLDHLSDFALTLSELLLKPSKLTGRYSSLPVWRKLHLGDNQVDLPYNQLLVKLGGQKRLLENMERNAEVGISLLRDD
jgi:hypothetical protein